MCASSLISREEQGPKPQAASKPCNFLLPGVLRFIDFHFFTIYKTLKENIVEMQFVSFSLIHLLCLLTPCPHAGQHKEHGCKWLHRLELLQHDTPKFLLVAWICFPGKAEVVSSTMIIACSSSKISILLILYACDSLAGGESVTVR